MQNPVNFILLIVLISCVSCSNNKNTEVNKNIFLQYKEGTFIQKAQVGEKMFIIIPCT